MGGRRVATVLVAVSVAVVWACDSTPTGPSPIDRVVIEAGDAQTAGPGETLPNPIVARVYREDDSHALYLLRLQLVDGGGVDLGGVRGSGEGLVLHAPELGVASAMWTLPGVEGQHRLRFFAVRQDGDTVETFATATAVAPR